MNAIDTGSHDLNDVQTSGIERPSLLIVIIDTNPECWSALEKNGISIHDAISAILIFINAHLALNHANKTAVIAAHSQRAQYLYPSPNGSKDPADNLETSDDEHSAEDFPNMYKQFRQVDKCLLQELSKLMTSSTTADMGSKVTAISGALCLALSYMNRFDQSSSTTTSQYQSRILIISTSQDLSAQYIPIMNCVFAAQKFKIPIDVCKLGGGTAFLQQATDATGGIHMHIDHPRGLLQYLVSAFLPDPSLRPILVIPMQSDVDFRAACFCHRKVVDIGYVCSICLSIFCAPPSKDKCPTCGAKFDPKVLEKMKWRPLIRLPKKRKKGSSESRAGTPGTPA